MKNKHIVRLIALCLAAVSLIGMVGALSYDRNGDGRTNIWDLMQVDKKDHDAALAEALGGGDELNPTMVENPCMRSIPFWVLRTWQRSWMRRTAAQVILSS